MTMIKSLLLGSAAGLLAIGGAQAADLPVKAKAVEYVKVCSLYGAGFYYIPGTDTCIKLGGYLRMDILANTNTDDTGNYSGTAGANNRLRNYYTWRSREDLNIDTRTATEYGVLRTFADITFSWTTPNTPTGAAGTFSPAQQAGIAGSDTIGVYYAFIQFAGFTLGKAVSQFDTPWQNYPANNFDGLVGGGGDVTGVNQVAYTFDFGQGITASISAQDQVAYYQTAIWNLSNPVATTAFFGGSLGNSTLAGAGSPDIVGMLRVDQAWGLFQASAALHDNHAGFYAATPTFSGSGTEIAGHPSDKWGWAGQLALSIKNIPTGPGDTINVQGVYTNGASRYNFQSLAPTAFAIFSGTSMPGAYQSIGLAGVSDATFVTGGDLQLVTTYGFRGGYTHNWNPYWNTSVFGAWAAVRYNDTSKVGICAALAPALTANASGLNCNPDFSVSQIGTKTAWTPVKNLTFSGEYVYTMLNQNFVGNFNATAAQVAAIGKPAGAYEAKNQNTSLFMFRAQRNW